VDIHKVIQDITPLYNHYKKESKSISGSEALKIMWDLGSILKIYIEENNIAPHALYREIYGKGEGSKNIVRKSWIPREFQGRCYRIRNIFSSKDQIDNELPNLRNFTNFRECMPFFDNEKYKFVGEEKDKLLALLNSNNSNKYIFKTIKKLQKERIGRSNDRYQRLKDLENEKDIFINFYNYIYNMTQLDSDAILIKIKEDGIDSEYISVLAQNTNALSQDGLKFFDMTNIQNTQNTNWMNYCGVIIDFLNQKDPKKIRRFRRLVPPERIVKLADMLYFINKNSK
jgi:hypothetical protein